MQLKCQDIAVLYSVNVIVSFISIYNEQQLHQYKL